MDSGGDKNPYRTRSIWQKVSHCLRGFRLVTRENSYAYLAGQAISLVIFGLTGCQSLQDVIMLFYMISLPLAFEMVNSSIEASLDRHGYGYHPMTRDAKDMAAAASMYSQIITTVTVIMITLQRRFFVTA